MEPIVIPGETGCTVQATILGQVFTPVDPNIPPELSLWLGGCVLDQCEFMNLLGRDVDAQAQLNVIYPNSTVSSYVVPIDHCYSVVSQNQKCLTTAPNPPPVMSIFVSSVQKRVVACIFFSALVYTIVFMFQYMYYSPTTVKVESGGPNLLRAMITVCVFVVLCAVFLQSNMGEFHLASVLTSTESSSPPALQEILDQASRDVAQFNDITSVLSLLSSTRYFCFVFLLFSLRVFFFNLVSHYLGEF